MSKTKSYQLFKRGKKGYYSLRIYIAGKPYWRSTKTSDKADAKINAEAIVDKLKSAVLLAEREASVYKITSDLAEAAVKEVTGKTTEKITLASAHDVWEDLQDEYLDLQQTTRSYHEAMFNRFVEWVNINEEIKLIDQVTPEIAKRYAKYLWKTKVTPKTFNEYIQHLSSVFDTLDRIHFLPYRNPFDKSIVQRRKKNNSEVESHLAIEPDDIKKLVDEAALLNEDYRDLFIIGANTGLRLKDACLLEWNNIEDSFIDLELYKTTKTGNRARIPISSTLQKVLNGRPRVKDEYVLPSIAANYLSCASTVRKKTKLIFENVFEKVNTQAKKR